MFTHIDFITSLKMLMFPYFGLRLTFFLLAIRGAQSNKEQKNMAAVKIDGTLINKY